VSVAAVCKFDRQQVSINSKQKPAGCGQGLDTRQAVDLFG